MAKKSEKYNPVNDQGPAPKITNTGLKALAKTGCLYKTPPTECSDSIVVPQNSNNSTESK